MVALMIRENPKKLKELILYISQKCASDPNFGAIKLNKILYFSDFASFAHYGEPITGAEYQKLEQGPAPRRMVPVRNEMQRSGWKIAALKETIPYAAVFLCEDQKLTESDVIRGQQIAREYGLLEPVQA
jgi:hypothetical protein